MKAYRWVGGPPAVSRIGAPGRPAVARGEVILLTDAQRDWYAGRGYSFAEDAPEPAAGERKEKSKTTTKADEAADEDDPDE